MEPVSEYKPAFSGNILALYESLELAKMHSLVIAKLQFPQESICLPR